MCETNAYVYKDGEEELYFKNVDVLIPEGSKIYIRNFFGEQKTFEGYVKEIYLSQHKIVLKEAK